MKLAFRQTLIDKYFNQIHASLQKQIGCFNHLVVIQVCSQAEAQLPCMIHNQLCPDHLTTTTHLQPGNICQGVKVPENIYDGVKL